MLRLASVLVCTTALTAGAAPIGKVVRVERPRGIGVPRVCVMQYGSTTGICVGKAQPGERITLVSPTRRVIDGEFRIDVVSDATDFCSTKAPKLSKVSGVVVEGDPSALADGDTIGLRGVNLKRSIVRVMENKDAPSGRSSEKVFLTLDTDGNGSPDLVLVRYTCNDQGVHSNTSEQVCIDTLQDHKGRLERVHQDIIEPCN